MTRLPNYIRQREKIDEIIKKLKKGTIVRVTKGKYEGFIGEFISCGDYKANIKVGKEFYNRYNGILTINICWLEIL